LRDTPWWEAVDHRPLALEMPWPQVEGQRCLDIGTANGFWAFELERRGASDVLATDRPSPFQAMARAAFEEARDASASKVRYEERNVFDLDGEFDLAFMGYVLQMVTDPIGALEAVRRVSRELILLDTVSLPLSLVPSPLARLDARRDGREWFVFNSRGLRKVVELAGWTVERQTGILRDNIPEARGDWRMRTGVRGRACAILARRN
jgi:tRNA (mo5U34)-methyltransferase